MKPNNDTPSIRFAGFTDTWEQRKLGELCDVFRSGEFIKASDIYEDGAFPVYGGNGLRGYADRFNYDGDYALIGRQGALCGNMNFSSGKAYFTEHAVAVHANDNNNTRFLFYLLDTMNLGQYSAQSAQPGLAVNKLITLPALCPSKLEQETIAEFLTRIDDLITLHQRKYDQLVNIKKSMLEKMFPKNGETVPEVRFAGFTDAWEQRKLGDVYQKIRNAFVGTATPFYVKNGHFYLESNNVKNGEINRNSEVFINDDFYEKQRENWLHSGDIVMVQSGHVGHSAVIPDELDNTAAHALIIIANPNVEISPYFVNFQFLSPTAVKRIEHITTGNTIKHILASDMKQFEILVPVYAEQIQISQLFDKLGSLITLHQRKLERLQNIKKACLEKMFV